MATTENITNQLAEQLTGPLNPPQKSAVLTTEGPLLILAGAGSGKTRVLTHRMAFLIAEGKAAPDEVLCVTFTNKAAKEMEHRIYTILGDLGFPVHGELWISTFHSFCVRILRRHIELLEYKSFFVIYDSGDQLSLIKKVMTALNINEKMYPAKSFQSRISHFKMQGMTPADLERAPRNFLDAKSLEVYKQYEIEMKRANALDFDDLLLKTYELFQMYPAILAQYQEKFKYIMVDEYQDTNHIQYRLILTLAQKNQQLCVVGDEDQSIYSWRGADIQNILSFERDFPNAKIVKLEENYRSSGNIVKAATQVIRNNQQRKEKSLFTSQPAGELIEIREENNEYDEARYVSQTIQKMMSEGDGSYNDYAIFYRTNAQSRVLEEQLRTLSIPYRIVGGTRFYERMEIKDVLGYMRLSLNPADDVSVKRIINVPTRGIGKTTVDRLEELAAQRKITLLVACQQAIDEKIFNAGTTGKLRRFFDLMADLRQQAMSYPLPEFYHIILDKTQYLQILKQEDTPEAESRIENLEELDNAIEQFCKERGEDSGLQSFLEEMALVSDIDSYDQQVNTVTMMTLHISKGLEFPFVFVVGLEENLFPSGRSSESNSQNEMEEERRLAYVGMTRARQRLWLTHCRMRRVWGQDQMNPPSRFIGEIPKECIRFSTSHNRGSFVGKYTGLNSYKTPEVPSMDSFDSFPDYDQSPSDSYSQGMRVRHPTFGVGSIYSVEGDGEHTKVSVLFADKTLKKFVVKYARLEKL